MADIIMVRTFSQKSLEEFAKYSSVPVINGLTDSFHPIQLMSDYMTIIELGKKEPIVAYIGDGNNMAHSWLIISHQLSGTESENSNFRNRS